MKRLSVPFFKRETSLNCFVPELEVLVDGNLRRFLFDTGAVSSTIAFDVESAKLPVVDKSEMRGASGLAESVDVVQPQTIQIANLVIANPKLKRTRVSIFGLDLIESEVIRIDFNHMRLEILSSIQSEIVGASVRRLKTGHVTIDLAIGGQETGALFDTGADTTIIDERFILANQASFQQVRIEDGKDATGNTIQSRVYLCKSVSLCGLEFKNIEMAAFDFGADLRGKMEGLPIILGNNLISKGIWTIDLSNNKFSFAPLDQSL